MSSFVYTANNASQLSDQITTDKVRIATITPIHIEIGNSSVEANATTSMIIPANTVEDSIIVGQGNYIAYLEAGTTTSEPFSVTELGAPHANTGTSGS